MYQNLKAELKIRRERATAAGVIYRLCDRIDHLLDCAAIHLDIAFLEE